MVMRPVAILFIVALLGGRGLHGQEIIDPDAEVFEVGPDDTVIVNQPPASPTINVDTSNVIHNNFPAMPAPQIVTVPAASAPQIQSPEVVTVAPTVVTAAPAVVTAAPTVVTAAPAVVTPVRYGVGYTTLGNLLYGGRMGVGGLGLGGVGLGGMGLGMGMLPMGGLLIGR